MADMARALIPQTMGPEALPSLAGVSLLLVDDDVDGCCFMRTALERAGALVLMAHDCARAHEWLGRVRVDMLLSDFHLPDGDGFGLMRAARKHPAHEDTPVRGILLSASDEIDASAAAAVGFERVLRKPISPGALVHSVAELTHRAD